MNPMRDDPADAINLYLDLMKKTLSFSMWEDIPVPVDVIEYGGTLTKMLGRFVSRLLSCVGLQLVMMPPGETQRIEGRAWPRQAHTMIGMKRLDNIQYCTQTVLKDNIPGDFLEAGVWRGGASIFMRAILAAHGVSDRRIWVADSFEGLPKPNEEKYPEDKNDAHHKFGVLAISRQQVEENFRKYGLLDKQVMFLQGWFKDTLPNAPVDKLAVLRLDGDMYQSTMETLTCLYHKLSRGGFCIIDDYSLEPCRNAVSEFRSSQGITAPIEKIDWTGVYWRKDF